MLTIFMACSIVTRKKVHKVKNVPPDYQSVNRLKYPKKAFQGGAVFFFLGVKMVLLPVKNMAKYRKSAREKKIMPVKIFVNLHP